MYNLGQYYTAKDRSFYMNVSSSVTFALEVYKQEKYITWLVDFFKYIDPNLRLVSVSIENENTCSRHPKDWRQFATISVENLTNKNTGVLSFYLDDTYAEYEAEPMFDTYCRFEDLLINKGESAEIIKRTVIFYNMLLFIFKTKS